MEEIRYEWQYPNYREIALQMQQQLANSIAYGDRIFWREYDGSPRLYLGRHPAIITTELGYIIQANPAPISSVASVCCMASSSMLVAFAISGTGTRNKRLIPIFRIVGDFTMVSHFTEFMCLASFQSEHNRIEKTKERRNKK